MTTAKTCVAAPIHQSYASGLGDAEVQALCSFASGEADAAFKRAIDIAATRRAKAISNGPKISPMRTVGRWRRG